MLTKDLLRVSRAGGGYHPQFVDDRTDLAARVIGVYQGYVGHSRADLEAALTDLERESDDFKLVRGFAKLVERDATFETRASLDPQRARRAAFAAGEAVGVVTESEREAALSQAADRLDATPDGVAASLYADLDARQVLAAVDPRWDPPELCTQYNLSLAQMEEWDHLPSEVKKAGRRLVTQYNLSLAMTSLFDATELRIRSSDPRALISAVKRLRLMYEIQKVDSKREVVVTGPDSLFRTSRRYGTRFARLLRTVSKAQDWHLEATIDDRGTERTMGLSDDDPIEVPDTEPMTDVQFDSSIEEDFATRFESLDLDWELTREPEPLETHDKVMIPDFAFDYKYADFRIFFEIMGFWTPEYVEKKLDQLESLEDVEMLVAVDESLGVGEEIEARDHRAIGYSKSIRIKDVRDVLRQYEDGLISETVDELPDELRPSQDVTSFGELAAEYETNEQALRDIQYPKHEMIGQMLIRPCVLRELASELEPGLSLEDAEEIFDGYGISDSSSLLSALGYRVEWDGLSGGTIQMK